ncbi:hypothetical protein QUF75_01815 [Desulfococcaceae bacterium HSG7]|nr:hypothetical protein [Desulfococcaceae bacterium HSG7]
MCAVHGVEKIEKEMSGFYISDVISGVYRGMMIALPETVGVSQASEGA